MKPDGVVAAELSLSKCNSKTTSIEKFIKYLEERTKVAPMLQAYYSNEDTPKENQHTSGLLPFRKMKLSSFINRIQAEERLARNLRKKFGKDAALVLGDWSAGLVKYHEPIRGIGMRRMLVKQGFQVYLLDEFKTSSMCPSCGDGELEKFKMVENPRPYQRENNPTVIRHGLLRYMLI